MEIARRPELAAHALNLPALDFGLEIFAQRLQRLISVSPTSTFETCSAPSLRPIPGSVPRLRWRDVVSALLREAPELAGILEPDPLDQIADQTKARRHRAKLMASGCIPADMAALEHGDAGAKTRGFPCHRQSGKSGADHANIDIEVERQAGAETAWRRRQTLVGLVEASLMAFSYGPLQPCHLVPGMCL